MGNKKEKSSAGATLGKIGGPAIFRKRGKAYMSRIGKKGARARWTKAEKKSDPL